MGGGKGRKMNGGPATAEMNGGTATADQARDGEKRLKQKLLPIGSAKKKKYLFMQALRQARPVF
jgi:hypothetical protein